MSNSTDPIGLCELSPHARAISTVLTAFVGSVIGGMSGGYRVAAFTAWVCWFASLRVLNVGIWAVFEAVQLRPVRGGNQFHEFYSGLPVVKLLCSGAKTFDDPFFRDGARAAPPTFLGWVGWVFATCYAPTTQILWIVGNWNKASGQLKLVRAIGVSVTALPLTIDTKARYGDAVERLLGGWGRCVFTLITATGCLVLGVASPLLLILAAIDLKMRWYIILIYVIFLLVWTNVSFSVQVPHDEASSPSNLRATLGGAAMGFGTGLFVAAPALIIMTISDKSGSSLKSYLGCETVALWHKFIALFP